MATLNCRGLKKLPSTSSGRQFARILRHLQYDILCLQETHVDNPDLGESIRCMLQGHSAAWTSHCGVVCFNPHFNITTSQSLFNDRLLMVTLTNSQQLCDDITLYIVYAPAQHTDRPSFFHQVHTFMQSQPLHRSIILGDFNYNIHRTSNISFPAAWNSWLLSIWHDPIYADSSTRDSATFHRGSNPIDFILCTSDLRHHIHQPQISYVSHTDHNAVSIKLTTGVAKSGPGLWRFNPTLMKSAYVRKEINTWLDIASCHMPPTTPQAQWDWLKLHLKAFCETLSCKAASHRQRQLQYLQREYRTAIKAHRRHHDNNSQSHVNRLRSAIADIQNDEADTHMLRAGIRWREKGERSNAYFFQCLKERQAKQHIHALQTEDGSLVSDPNEMMHCARAFYSTLYRAEDIDHSAVRDLLTAIPQSASLGDDDCQLLLEPWSDDEIVQGLSRSPHHSSPGIDGFPYELLKFIYHHPCAKRLLKQVFNEALTNHRTPESWRKAVVTLLPKSGDRTSLRNWRPISLICTDAKVFTRMVTTRLAPFMKKLINPYQTGFLHDRFIADNGLLTRLVMSLAQKYDITGAALLLDQEKAYDRVHPEYLQAVLHHFGFPAPFVDSIMHLFFNTQLSININGYISAPCQQQRGLRQGDPLSPLLFNLMLEPLLQSLLSSPSLRGFSFDIPNAPTSQSPFMITPPPLKTLAYADDVLIFVTHKEEVQAIMNIIKLYCRASNAKLNCQKTLVVSLNGHVPDDWKQAFSSQDLHQWHDRTSPNAAIYLGFPLTSTHQQLADFLQSRLEKLKNNVHIMQSRSLSIRGKALVANSLLLSKMWYCLRILPLNQVFLKSIQSVITQFLQSGAFPKVSFLTCCRPKTEGGLGILHPIHHLNALQLRWVQPLLSNDPDDHTNSLADPYLRFCIHAFCATLSPIVPLLFPERRAHSLLSLGHFKMLFQASDHLKLKVNWTAITHFTVQELPLNRICTFAGLVGQAPNTTWGNLLVRDAFILSTQANRLRGRTSHERTRYRRRISTFHRVTASQGTWRLKPFFKHLLATLPPRHDQSSLSHDYQAMVASQSHSHISINDITRKQFRYSLLPQLSSLPASYPKAHHAAWHRFWNAPIPHRACTLLWRLFHHRLSSRQRLQALLPRQVDSATCSRCEHDPAVTQPEIESDQHLLFSCPAIQAVWHTLSRRFLVPPQQFQWKHLHTISARSPSLLPHPHITSDIIIACGMLAIWRAHWAFVFEQVVTPANIIADSAIHHINRIIDEIKLATSTST